MIGDGLLPHLSPAEKYRLDSGQRCLGLPALVSQRRARRELCPVVEPGDGAVIEFCDDVGAVTETVEFSSTAENPY